jgi:hypothetical protein
MKRIVNESSPELSLKIEQDISKLRDAVIEYDYSQLRAVKIKKEDGQIARTSEEGINGLLQMFSHTFLYSSDKALREYYRSINNWPASQYNQVMRLADTLITFKNRVAESEEKYFQEIGRPDEARLKETSNWVLRFHFCIEQQLVDNKSFSLVKYKNFIKNVQTLGEKVFLWIEKNAPNKKPLYETLQPHTKYQSENFEKFNSFLKTELSSSPKVGELRDLTNRVEEKTPPQIRKKLNF